MFLLLIFILYIIMFTTGGCMKKIVKLMLGVLFFLIVFLLVFVLFAVHSTFDPQLTWIGYNCFLMAYSYIHDGQAGEKSSGNEKTKYSC